MRRSTFLSSSTVFSVRWGHSSGAVAGCRWADPATLLETGAEVLLLFLLMTVEGWGMGEEAQITRAGLFQSEMVLRPEALGLRHPRLRGFSTGGVAVWTPSVFTARLPVWASE